MAKDGLKICIRSLGFVDKALLEEFCRTLSPRTIRLRFFATVNRICEDVFSKLLPAYHHDNVLLLATTRERDGREQVVGLFSLVCDDSGKVGEFSLLVGDPWQGRGIGRKLLQHGLVHADARGIGVVWGMCLPENTHALALARKMGFITRWDSQENAYFLRLESASSGKVLTRSHPISGRTVQFPNSIA